MIDPADGALFQRAKNLLLSLWKRWTAHICVFALSWREIDSIRNFSWRKEEETKTNLTFLLPLIYVESLYKSLSNKLELQKYTIYIFKCIVPPRSRFFFSFLENRRWWWNICPYYVKPFLFIYTKSCLRMYQKFFFIFLHFFFLCFFLFCLGVSCLRGLDLFFTFTSVAVVTFHWFCWSVNRTNQRRKKFLWSHSSGRRWRQRRAMMKIKERKRKKIFQGWKASHELKNFDGNKNFLFIGYHENANKNKEHIDGSVGRSWMKNNKRPIKACDNHLLIGWLWKAQAMN